MDKRATRQLEVMVGTNNLGQGGTYYRTSKIIKHSHYKAEVLEVEPPTNDIALLKINGTIVFNNKVKSIELSKNTVRSNTPLILSRSINLKII